MHIHAVKAELRGMRQRIKRGEARESGGAEEDTIAEPLNEVKTVERGEVKGLSGAPAVVEGREEAWEGGRVNGGCAGVVGKSRAGAEAISFAFFRGQTVFPG
jgi:hypothetical protein